MGFSLHVEESNSLSLASIVEQGHLQETGCGADLKSGPLSQLRMKAVFCLFIC